MLIKNLNRLRIMLILSILLLGVGKSWATSTTYYAALKAQVSSTGGGKVYAGTSATAGTYVEGSSTSSSQTSTTQNDEKTFYAFAQANEGYSFIGWSTANGESIVSTNNPYSVSVKCSSSTKNSPTTTTVYANFARNQAIGVTFMPPTNGSYTVNGTKITTSQSITCEGSTALAATAASGYKFFGWYTSNDGGTTKNYFSHTPSTSYAFQSAATVYAEFILSSVATFVIKGTSNYYYDLAQGLTAASSSTSKVLVVASDGSVAAGNYTIPSGVTLLVPFDAANTVYTTEPGINKAAPSGQSAYRKLTLAQNASISVNNNGAISVSAMQSKNQPYGGCVTGAYGQIDLKDGSTIILNGGAKLYCWGYITGTGMVEAKKGSSVYEDFQITCWRGGSAANSMVNSKKVFALAQYYIQNIEAKLKFYAGAIETVYTGVTVSYVDPECSVKIIGTTDDVLFKISSGTLTKWYDADTDRQMYQIDGNSSIGYVYIDMYATIDSRDYVLPLTNNMDITVNTGTLTCDKKVGLLPGAKITINEGANISLESNSELYVYDKDNWGQYNYSTSTTKPVKNDGKICSLPYCAATGTGIATKRSWANTTDAIMDINGTITTASGHFYTANGSADICSSNGTGTITFTKAAGTKANTQQATQSGTNITYVDIPTTAVQLHNSAAVQTAYGAEFEYLATAGTAANTTINYANGHWGWMEIWKDEEGTILQALNTCTQQSGTAPSDPTKDHMTFAGWSTEISTTNQEVVHTATYTPDTYTITWKLDGKTVKTEQVAYGTMPDYGSIPTKESTVTEEFTFSGWIPDLAPVTKDQTYSGSFNGTTRQYTITWLNADGSLLTTTSVGYGRYPEYPFEEDPTYSDGAHILMFSGWSPALVEVEEETTYTATYEILTDLEVNGEMEIPISTNLLTATIRVSGSLSVAEGKKLSTQMLVLEASPTSSGQITGEMEAEVAFLDYALGGSQAIWYDVAVPWEVDATTGIYVDGVRKQLNKDFFLIYYNGALRASQNKHSDACWQFVNKESSPDKFMHPGRLYMIYLSNAGVDKLRFERCNSCYGSGAIETPEIFVHQYDAVDEVNAGWNGIANPAIYKAYLNAGANTVEVGESIVKVPNYGQKYVPESDTYEAFNMDETPFRVSEPVFVQVAAEHSVVIDPTSFPALAAPVRKAKVDNAYYEVQIAAGEDCTDRIFLLVVEGKEERYRVGLDLAKAGVSTKVAQMWVSRYGSKLCVNTTAPKGTAATYPLTIQVPADGEYQINSATEMQDNQEMYVTLNGRAIWNLAYGPYEVFLTQGTHTEYGLKLVQSPAVTTDIVNAEVMNGATGVRKVLIDNQIYIIREGAVYTINGQVVK